MNPIDDTHKCTLSLVGLVHPCPLRIHVVDGCMLGARRVLLDFPAWVYKLNGSTYENHCFIKFLVYCKKITLYSSYLRFNYYLFNYYFISYIVLCRNNTLWCQKA